ncbi:hypothetical protein ABZ470_15445 [Streptosporangium sp. NPDC020072]|uniref:hypothetical protein n=1 Tax=Streptosporangium sp. NPDC020072 TaxID=3154788 RepID=UPI00343483BC
MITRKAAVAAAGVLALGGLVYGHPPAQAGTSGLSAPLATCRSYTNDARTIGYGGCTVMDGWERWRLGVRCTTGGADYHSPWQYTSHTKSYRCPGGGRVTGVWTDSES